MEEVEYRNRGMSGVWVGICLRRLKAMGVVSRSRGAFLLVCQRQGLEEEAEVLEFGVEA